MENSFSSVGERIAACLQEKKLKQADLCRDTGISSNAISQYVTGKRIPDTTSLHKIAHVLGVPMEWILTGKHPSNENQSNERIICDGIPLNQNEMDLIAMYRFLSPSDRKTIFDIVKLKYDQTTGEKESFYSTYSDTNETQNDGAQDIHKIGSGIA